MSDPRPNGGKTPYRRLVLATSATFIAVTVFATLLLPAVLPKPELPTLAPPPAPLVHVRPPLNARKAQLMPTFKTRNEIGAILQKLGMTSGVELGVQKGKFAAVTLAQWPSCRRYLLVDLWQPQPNYFDLANNVNHAAYKAATMTELENYRDKIEVCQNYTSQCARKYSGQSFDYIYVDARHDYKGVLDDLNAWWPLLKPGGIFAGHDYVTNDDGPRQNGQDWSVNYDGSRDHSGRAVKGAVDDFCQKMGLQITVSYRERGWNTWAVRKPL